MIELTAKEIADLAEFAGFTVDTHGATECDLEMEFGVIKCPEDGLKDEGDPRNRYHSRYIAYISDYPEEGSYGLGDVELRKLPEPPK